MRTEIVLELPNFDTGQYEDSEFLMTGGSGELTIHVAEVGSIRIRFSRLRWHQFTSLYRCDPEVVRSSYFRLVEVVDSREVKAIWDADPADARAYTELHHFRIFLDETGCHEVVAEAASLVSP